MGRGGNRFYSLIIAGMIFTILDCFLRFLRRLLIIRFGSCTSPTSSSLIVVIFPQDFVSIVNCKGHDFLVRAVHKVCRQVFVCPLSHVDPGLILVMVIAEASEETLCMLRRYIIFD